jgi:hypothetical protein
MAGSYENRLQAFLISLPVATLVVVILGLFTGSEVFSWRLLYTRRIAWKAHYTEAFRCCIREALCCMGRYRYLYISKPLLYPLTGIIFCYPVLGLADGLENTGSSVDMYTVSTCIC